MKVTISNVAYLTSHFAAIKGMIESGKCVTLDYGEAHRPKTKSQLGFIFGGLVDTIKSWWFDQTGEMMTTDQIKNELYDLCGIKSSYCGITGKTYNNNITLSGMTVEQCNFFIDKVVDFIDNNLDGCILPPDIRYCWTRHITKEDILWAQSESAHWPKEQPEYLNHLRNESCINCGIIGCDPHHLRIGNKNGVAMKNPDYMTIPLCHKCHAKLHQDGEQCFYAGLSGVISKMDIQDFVIVNFSRYINHVNKKY